MNPFDTNCARGLFQALGQCGDVAAQQRLAREYRAISRAAAGIVREEEWFHFGFSITPPAPRSQTPFGNALLETPFREPDPKPSFEGMRPQTEFGNEGQNLKSKIVPSISSDDFRKRYGVVDDGRAIHGFTRVRDTQVVLALLVHHRPRRILEIGTAAGHMTANLSEWSADDAQVFSIGVIAGRADSAPVEQRPEDPPEAGFGKQANHFGKGHKVTLIAADSLEYNFQQIAPIDFAFIDGGRTGVRNEWHCLPAKVSWCFGRRIFAVAPPLATHGRVLRSMCAPATEPGRAKMLKKDGSAIRI
jgi:hypothetical protein